MPTLENASHFLMTPPHQSTFSSLRFQHHRASKTGKNNATTHATLGLLRGSLSAHHPRWNDHLKFTPKPFVAAISPLSNRKKQAIIRNSNHPQNNSPPHHEGKPSPCPSVGQWMMNARFQPTSRLPRGRWHPLRAAEAHLSPGVVSHGSLRPPEAGHRAPRLPGQDRATA